MPLAIAPTGMAGLMWFDGETALARAAAEAKVPFTLTTNSVASLEQVAVAGGGRLGFQLVERAAAAGYKALLVTLDTAANPNREYNMHNGMTIPYRITLWNAMDSLMRPNWLCRVMLRYMLSGGRPTI